MEELKTNKYELVPLRADQAFVYPDPAFWKQLEAGEVFSPGSVDSIAEVAMAYRQVFTILALMSSGKTHFRMSGVRAASPD